MHLLNNPALFALLSLGTAFTFRPEIAQQVTDVSIKYCSPHKYRSEKILTGAR